MAITALSQENICEKTSMFPTDLAKNVRSSGARSRGLTEGTATGGEGSELTSSSLLLILH